MNHIPTIMLFHRLMCNLYLCTMCNSIIGYVSIRTTTQYWLKPWNGIYCPTWPKRHSRQLKIFYLDLNFIISGKLPKSFSGCWYCIFQESSACWGFSTVTWRLERLCSLPQDTAQERGAPERIGRRTIAHSLLRQSMALTHSLLKMMPNPCTERRKSLQILRYFGFISGNENKRANLRGTHLPT